MRLLVFGLGYTGSAIARAAAAEGFAVSGTVRDAIEAADIDRDRLAAPPLLTARERAHPALPAK